MITTNQHLSHLETAGLIRLAQTQPELEYLFRHALVQDVAYKSLLRQDRKRLHQVVGTTLERLYPNELDELSPVLGHHFAMAGDDRRALKYFTLAGDAAAAIYANAEAVVHFTRALDIAKNQAGLSTEQLIHLFTQRGRSLELSGRFDEAETNYQDMETLAAERGDRPLELAGLIAHATVHVIPSLAFNPAQGQALSQQALALAQELGDRQAEAKILWSLMLLHFFTGRIDEALGYGEQSLALARELNLREQLAFTLNDLAGFIYLPTGQHEKGQTAMAEARAIWEELDNRPMLADNLATSAFNKYFVGEFEEALALTEEAYRASQPIGNLWGQAYSRALKGLVHLERGEVHQSIRTLEEGIYLGEQAGFLPAEVIAGSFLAVQYGLLGDVSHGLELAHRAAELAGAQVSFWLPLALGSLALLQIHSGHLAAAEEAIQRAWSGVKQEGFFFSYILTVLADCELGLAQEDYARVITLLNHHIADVRQRHNRTFLPYLLHSQGRTLLGQGQLHEAYKVLAEARAAAEALGSRQNLWPILFALSQLEADLAEVKRLRKQAQEIVEFITDHTPTPELRASFLDLPDVRLVLNQELNT